MSFRYSDWSFGMTDCGGCALSAVAPSCAPLKEYSLKFLSLSVPMSVTTPIFALLQSVGAVCAAPALAPAQGSGATLAAGLPPLPVGVHADNSRAATDTRVSPIERERMVPPPASTQPGRDKTLRGPARRRTAATAAHRSRGRSTVASR